VKDDAPSAEAILETLLKAAAKRANHLLENADLKPDFEERGGRLVQTVGFTKDDADELPALIRSIVATNEADLRWLQKLDPKALQGILAERVRKGLKEEEQE